MRVLQINAVYPNGSTGKICRGIYLACRDNGVECFVAYSHGKSPYKEGIAINSSFWNRFANRLSRITMLEGCFSFFSTFLFLKKIKKIKPDIIHIHNIHENFINFKPLFNYIIKNNIKTIFTAHDCWFFTGYCKYFTSICCEKWKTECKKCPKKGFDKVNFFDNSKRMFLLKKNLFSKINDLTIISPSRWLSGLLKESFLKNKKIVVINNGIDLSVFKPTDGKIREMNNIKNNEFVILGVASSWESRKGLDVFVELSKTLPDDYRIILVGTDDVVDKRLPRRIISIHRTNNQEELAALYTSADLFVNPTKEENFPTVNIEALACGTPVLTFDTGGSAEIIDKTCGSVVDCGDFEKLKNEIMRIRLYRPFSKKDCLKRALCFNSIDRYMEYLSVYKNL